jgi:uncharacterized protein YbjQ (UPF0145 family)
MENVIGLVCYIVPFLFLIGLGIFVGGATERKHIRDLDRREALHRDVLITQVKTHPYAVSGPLPPEIVIAEAVIATDYLKSFFGKWRNFFGGEMKSYRLLIERARREATMRIVEQAKARGFNAVCNIRFVTSDIGGSASSKKGAVMAALMASGTAYHADKTPPVEATPV